MLVFPADIVVNDSQWNASTVVSTFPDATDLAAFKYVELTGEHITFVVDSSSNRPADELPANMPRLPICGKKGELTSGYQWPYSQAAAVVDIPEGTLSVRQRGVYGGRIDTKLMLNTTGTLTVVAAKTGVVKTLVLNTTYNPTIYLANVPPLKEGGLMPAADQNGHYFAYYRMVGREETGTCVKVPRQSAGTPAIPQCENTPGLLFIAPLTPAADGTVIIPSVNAECSNTQWP